jgi:inorganic triphosphatase YgiF
LILYDFFSHSLEFNHFILRMRLQSNDRVVTLKVKVLKKLPKG